MPLGSQFRGAWIAVAFLRAAYRARPILRQHAAMAHSNVSSTSAFSPRAPGQQR